MKSCYIMILGVGNILFCDDGFGVHVLKKIADRYSFPENVSLVDGGVLGLNLLGVISEADKLIVIDAIRNRGEPGDMYRLEGDGISERIQEKSSLHQVDLLEALTLCQALDYAPDTVILGVEPEDIDTLKIQLTPIAESKVDSMIEMVLVELDRLCVPYSKGKWKERRRKGVREQGVRS